jgi:tetratricopeptide (TPR) repeat protein
MEYSHGQAEALNGLGAALLAMGQPQDALRRHDEARTLADQCADPYHQARAYQGLGNAYAATGDHIRARERWQHALAIYTRIGTPEADQIRAQLNMHHQPS